MSKNRPFNHAITFRVLGKTQKTLKEQMTEALNREDYEACAKLESQMQDEKIKELLR